MRIDIISAFPEIFPGPLNESILKRAQAKNLLTVTVHDLRAGTTDKHHQVDDYPYGGGPGMVLKPEPLARAIRHVPAGDTPGWVIYLSPDGRPLTQAVCRSLVQREHLILVCGRYKGIDERIRTTLVDEEISIGDYVLSGGELPALVLTDALARLIPGVLGDEESAKSDSFENGLLDCPQYTRPEEFEGENVPPVLLSGHHENIAAWRREQALTRTRERRADLWKHYQESGAHTRRE
ncbi:MAG: tRNA (guanosine(37)-N1)-methyltransferase TrmD [Planctomycetes bacterium]|nr:tRNA (guanosine(37)-N1)-methyltransferase TrmD [Planctomycetota bacterium]